MVDDDILAEVTRTLSATPRTGQHSALMRMSVVSGDVEQAGRFARCVAQALRSGDLVHQEGSEISVLLRGVQDLPNALQVARRIAASSQEFGPVCAGVTLLIQGESSASVSLRAQGALDLAVDAGPGSVVSSPPLPA